MQRISIMAVISLAMGFLAIASPADAAHAIPANTVIRWQFGDEAIPSAEPNVVNASLQALSASRPFEHAIVCLAAPVEPSQRERMREAGVHLLAPLGASAFFARVDVIGNSPQARAALDTIIAVRPIRLEYRLHSSLSDGAAAPWPSARTGKDAADEPILVNVVFHADIERAAVGLVAARCGAIRTWPLRTLPALVVEIPRRRIAELAAQDAVQWIEPALPVLSPANDLNRQASQADIAQAAPYGLNGAGVTVMVYDGGAALASHVDFGGRLLVADNAPLIDHATHVAGIIGGGGQLSGGQYRGIAPAVNMVSLGISQGVSSGTVLYDNASDMENDYFVGLVLRGAVLANNSLATNVALNGYPCAWEGDYGVVSGVIDGIVRGGIGKPIRMTWAAGNDRGPGTCGTTYHTIPPPCGAKNPVVVGAVNAHDLSMTTFSSWGPTDDGRLKPDIVGPGCNNLGGVNSTSGLGGYIRHCGTSMSAPAVAGCSALLLQDFRQAFPNRPDFSNALMKAILIHTAQDLDAPGPDYKTGYGTVRVVDAINHMRTGRFLESQVSQGGVYRCRVNVAAGAQPLKVTLVWDDPPATPNVTPALVNDLDLHVVDPGGVERFPWTLDPAIPSAPAVRVGRDRLNNVEQVFVAAPQPGMWTVEVRGFAAPQGPQAFALCAEPGLTATVIALPDGALRMIAPDQATHIRVRIDAIGEALVPQSAAFHHRQGIGAFTTTPLISLGGGEFKAIPPPLSCAAPVEYYFSVAGTVSGDSTFPVEAPGLAFTSEVGIETSVFSDDFEQDLGWTVQNVTLADGAWERAVPAGNGFNGDPPFDFDGSGRCFVTDNAIGNSDVDFGPTRLISPRFDLAAVPNPTLSYARWFSHVNGTPPPPPAQDTDSLDVELSNDDGASWVLAERVTQTTTWVYKTINIADFIAPTALVRVRFSVADFPNNSQTEAGIDAIAIVSHTCVSGPSCMPGDVNDDGIRDGRDVQAFVNALLNPPLPDTSAFCSADMDNNGTIDPVLDIALFVTRLLTDT